ncbi:MAG: hypothetical protein H7A21_18760 [Spirochaetales bacterium]|nr:hypothetical protein [Leptospiraceae bacterium]MCP5483485.1 hypothetical protein [Spirochaetales bacterium]MCP5486528.1 hypothetical protein [Spirochaetales bacterium]
MRSCSFRVCLLVLLTLVFTACGRVVYRTAYNQAEYLAMRELDSYFDLNDSQERQVAGRVRALHRWHRYQELPRYAATLRQLRALAEDGLEPAEVDWLFQSGRNFRDRIYSQVQPHSVEILAALSDEQIDHLAGALAESNEELEEELARAPSERLNDRAERTTDFLDDWTGGLRPEQRHELRELSARLPDTTDARLQLRRERQGRLISTLRAHDRDGLRALMQAWLLQADATQPAYYRQANEAWRARARDFVLGLDARLTAQQRRHFLARLDELIADLDELSHNM